MKGLLLKDFYMMLKYCRAYLLLVVVFIVVALSEETDNIFTLVYPCIFSGMLPITLLGYDERSKWNKYCATMPYTNSQIVSSKYVIGLFVQLTTILAMSISQSVKMCINATFSIANLLSLIMALISISLLSVSICLPFIFKLGVEKGRNAYYVVIGASCGILCAASKIASQIHTNTSLFSFGETITFAIFISSIIIYAISWYLSVAFYKKREI